MLPSSSLLAVALFVVVSTPFAKACSCPPSWGNLCDRITPVDIVLRATILERTESADINNDTIYSLQSVEAFKAENISEPEYAEGSTFDIAMPGNDGICGIYLEIGDDYLIDLSRSDEVIRAVGLCGLTREWSTVDAEDEAILREGCDDYDPCEGTCDEFQECKKGFDSSIGYYCEDTCDPSPCADDEECVLEYSTSCSQSEACGPEAICEQSGASPSPSPGRFITLTLPSGASIASTTGSGTGTPAPGELGDATALPPGASIDSTTSGTGAPSSGELAYLVETSPPVVSIDSTTGATPSPNSGRDIAPTLHPGANILDSTTGSGTGTSAPGELGDVMTLPPGATVDSSSRFETPSPIVSPTVSPTSSPTTEGGTDGSNGADGDFRGGSGVVWRATCLATIAAAAAGFGSVLGRGVPLAA